MELGAARQFCVFRELIRQGKHFLYAFLIVSDSDLFCVHGMPFVKRSYKPGRNPGECWNSSMGFPQPLQTSLPPEFTITSCGVPLHFAL